MGEIFVPALLALVSMRFENARFDRTRESAATQTWLEHFNRFFPSRRLDICKQLLAEARRFFPDLCTCCQARIRLAEGQLWQQQRNLDRAGRCYAESLYGFWRLVGRAAAERCDIMLHSRQADLAQCWHQAGKLRFDRGQFSRAERYYTRAIALKRDGNDPDNLSSLLIGLAQVYRMQGRYSSAEQNLHHALDLAQTHDERMMALHTWGLVQIQLGRFDQAGQLFARCLDLATAANDRIGMATAHHHLGEACQAAGDDTQALAHYDAAMLIDREFGNAAGIAASLHQRGIIYCVRGNYAEAQTQYEQALGRWQEIGAVAGQSQTWHELGILWQEQKEYAQARVCYDQSLQLAQTIGDRSGQMWVLYQLGSLALEQADDTQAERFFQASLEMAQAMGDKNTAARALHQLGLVYQVRRDWAAAGTSYQRAWDIRRQIGDRSGEAQTLYQWALIEHMQGNLRPAQARYEAALTIEREIGDRAGMAISLYQLGVVHITLGELERASECLREALRLWQEWDRQTGDWAAAADLAARLLSQINQN